MVDALSPRFMRERVDLVKLLRAMPSAPKPGECQYAPAMALVGVYLAHATTTKLVAEGRLSLEAGTCFNSALALNSFNVCHACSHGAVSQHNPDHEAFENMVFRLASVPIFYQDGFRQEHQQHHRLTNTADDPDVMFSRLPLAELGLWLGAFEDVDWPEDWVNQQPAFDWNNQTLKALSYHALQAAKAADSDFGRILHATWRRASDIAFMLLVIFFARYPHRNGTHGHKSEVDSFYNTTYRGQAEVDLWMMGEGSHHLHHAKPDIPYSRLPRVSLELEERHPELKAAFRGITGLDDLPHRRMPERVRPQEDPPDQRAWVTSCSVERSAGLLQSDPAAAIAGIGSAVGDNALDVCLNADMVLLRGLHEKMRLGGQKADESGPLTKATWCETVWSDNTKEELRSKAELIRASILEAGQLVGAEFTRAREGAAPITEPDDIKACYFQLFEAMARAFVPGAVGASFLEHLAGTLPRPAAGGHQAGAFRAFLESPIPEDLLSLLRGLTHRGSREQTTQRAANLVASLRSRL